MRGTINIEAVETKEGTALKIECRIMNVNMLDKLQLIDKFFQALNVTPTDRMFYDMAKRSGMFEKTSEMMEHTELSPEASAIIERMTRPKHDEEDWA